jgi:RNA polymerase sigma factor (sigma-70 family)
MEGRSDEDLFIYIACAETPADKALADTALAEIHRRYIKGLYARCLRMLHAYPDARTMAEELTQATLARAYEKAHQFRQDPDSGAGSSRTLAWLCKIALNLFRDHRRNPNRPGPLSNVVDLDVNAEQYSPEDFASLFLEDESVSYSRHHYQLVTEAFDALDERTQIVLIETLVQRRKSPGRTHMLRKTATALAERVGTSTDNVRRIRGQGMRQINAYIDKHKNNKAETDHE